MFRRFLALVGLLALVACGGAPAQPTPTQPTAANSSTGQTSFPVTVRHAGGTLTLDKPAQRVVVCSEEALDFLIVLGIQPIGYCSDRVTGATEGTPYALPNFFPSEKIGTPTFVGTTGQPSIEMIASLKPDLLIIPDYVEGLDQITQIAPTFVVSVDAEGYWRETLRDIGAVTDRVAQAEQFLSDYDATAAKLAEQLAPVAAQSPNLLLVYSYAASDGTALLGNDWYGSTPFTQLGFTVVEPADVTFANGVAAISPESVVQLKADMLVVLRPRLADGTQPTYPIDELLAARTDIKVLYQVFDSTRASTAPWTDRFVLEEVAGLLNPGGVSTPPGLTGAAFPRTIAHTRGEITLEAPPQRIVALEWTYVEDLLALGIQPVGVADIAGFNDWVKLPIPLDASVQDVGLRGEPSIEKIAALKPDLIIDLNVNTEANYAELSAIAPTLTFEPYPTDASLSQYDEMRQTFQLIASATGRDAEGEAVLAKMEQTFADAKDRLIQAGKTGAPFVVSQAWTGASAAEVRLFTENAMATQIIKELGLVPAWSDPVFQRYGFSSVSVEALPKLSADTHYFYVVQDDDNPFQSSAVKPLWDNLPFVKAGNAHALGGDTWLFGGPLSAELLATMITDSLLGLGEQ